MADDKNNGSVDSGNRSDDENQIIELTKVIQVKPDSTLELSRFDETQTDLKQLVAEVVGDDESAVSKNNDKASTSVSVPLAQLENVLEKVVGKLYSDKIEVMVMKVIEKTVEREIEKMNAVIEDVAKKEK